MNEEKQKLQDDTRSQWSTASKKEQAATTEDRIASKIAAEVLRDNQKLKGVHSGASIKKILEKEAKK